MKRLINKTIIAIIIFIMLFNIAGPFVLRANAENDEDSIIPVSQVGKTITAKDNVILSTSWDKDFCWQIYISEIDAWVNINGETGEDIVLTPAKVLSVLNYSSGDIYVRVKDSEDNVSDSYEIYVDNDSPESLSDTSKKIKSPQKSQTKNDLSDENTKNGDTKAGEGEEALTYNILVNYTFTTGELASDPYFATIDAGEDFDEVIDIPDLPGYTPYYNGEEISSLPIVINDIDRNYTYNIVYHPAEVTYVVEHYLQNAENDDYTFYSSETLTGYTLDEIGNVEENFSGFYPLLYEHPLIAADSSTVVRIYYDRYYYLMEFRLNGGTGVDPIYARYGTPVTIPSPTRNGYTFAGWDVDPPESVPIGGGTYTANWTPASATFNVLFWYENTTGTDKYAIAGSEELTGITGTILNPEDYKDDAFEDRDDAHFVYNPSKTETVELAGDGTTMVNVYFDRIIITFEFYTSYSGGRYSNLIHTMSGRWGSTFSQNNMSWPTDYDWQFNRRDSSGTMGMTFMDAFIPTTSMGSDTTIEFYPRDVSGNRIYFLKERLDGTFYQYSTEEGDEGLEANADNIVTSGGTFYFSEKYEGFSLQDYQADGTNYSWVYTKDGLTYTYTGKRYKTINDTTTTPQYGLVDGEIVELEYMTPRVWYLPYIYTPTSSTSGTLYGIVSSEYTRLSSRTSWIYDGDQTYNGAYVYRETDAAGTGTTYYGVVNGSVVPLTFTQGYFYGNNNETRYTSSYKYRLADPINEGSYNTYYILQNGTMSGVRLYFHDGAFYRTRTTRYEYTYTPSTSTRSGNYYIPDSSSEDGYTEVYLYRNGNRWYLTYDYTYTQTTGTNGTQYGYYDGEYVRIYYSDGRWYRTRELGWGGYEYSDEYDGPRYTRSNYPEYQDLYTGTKYTRTQTASGYDYSDPTDAYTRSNTSTYDETYQYYGLVNGQLVPLTAITEFRYNDEPYTDPHYTRLSTPNSSTGTVTYYGFVDGEMKLLSYENGFVDEWGNVYNGQRYSRTSNSSANIYTGTRYVRTNNSMPYSYKRIETNSGTQYALDSNMAHQRLNSTVSTGNFYYNGQAYNGTRYVETNDTSGTIYGFVDGVRYTLSRGSSYTGFGDTWTTAVIGNSIPNTHNYIIRYARNSYRIEYYNHTYFLDDDVRHVKYEYSLADCNFVPEYPYSLPYGMYDFVGWYDNEELIGEPFDFENETMPSNNITLYAKYEPRKLTVNVYKDLLSMTSETNLISTEQVTYGNLATVPDIPENEDYTFVGWFYQNRYGEEMPFQFSSMEVTQNLNIYGKWTSDVLVPYTVTYETEDGTKIAEEIMNSALAGSTKTFIAKTDRQLYEGYREHWFPLVSSHSILMEQDIENAYTFVYVYRDAVPYTVRYVNEETGEELLPSKTVEDNIYLRVTERYKPIPGYAPDAFKKSLTLSINGTNEIIFYYHEDDVYAPYVINYYVQTDNGYELYNYRNNTGQIGSTVTAPELTIGGYVFNPDAPGTLTSGTITADGLELNLYYDRTTYPYKVRYLEKNTNRVLAEETTGKGYFEEHISFNALDINGYDLVSDSTQELVIDIEEGEDPRHNVVTFYYRVKQAEINYVAVGPGSVDPETEYVSLFSDTTGSLATPEPNARFVGWFKDADCTIPVTAEDGVINADNRFTPAKHDGVNVSATYYAKFEYIPCVLRVEKTVDGALGELSRNFNFILKLTEYNADSTFTYSKSDGTTGNLTLDENNEFAFTLKHNESIKFNLISGTVYSVTETDANQDDYATNVLGASSGTLTADTVVNFINTKPAPDTTTIAVSKTVAGNMGNRDEEFEFTLQYSGNTSIVTAQKNGEDYPLTFAGDIVTFTLAHEDTIVFDGIALGTAYTVTETNANKNGYLTTIDGETSGIISEATVIAFTNTKNVPVPTRISTEFLYVVATTGIIILVTGCFLFLLRKRK